MKKLNSKFSELTAVFLILLLAVSGFSQNMANQSNSKLRFINKDMDTRIGPPKEFIEGIRSATFDVTYTGFSPDAQTAFQFAVDIWASLISSTQTITVSAAWQPLGPNVLGAAGPTEFGANFANAPQLNTWYPIAIAERWANANLNSPGNDFDINAQFSSNFSNWYFGTDGNTPAGKIDFVSVVLHELGHGLGFVGSMSIDSASGEGSWGGGTPLPFIYDTFTENLNGDALTNTALFPNPSTALAAQLTGGNLYFDGPNTRAMNNNNRARLYAPASWEEGSSYSHVDEATYPAGNINSLMTPSIGSQEAIHDPGPITTGMFTDMGWGFLVGIDDDVFEIPDKFVLEQNYPNPFNPSTTIDYYLPAVSRVTLKIYNLLGQEIRTLVNESQSTGNHTAIWDSRDNTGQAVSSGVYLYQIQAGTKTLKKKMVLIR